MLVTRTYGMLAPAATGYPRYSVRPAGGSAGTPTNSGVARVGSTATYYVDLDLAAGAYSVLWYPDASSDPDADAFTVAGDAVLAAGQPNYAPAKAGDAMALTSAYEAAKTAVATTALPANFAALAIEAGTGKVTTANPSSGSTVTEASIWAYAGSGGRSLTDKSGFGLADGSITSAKFGAVVAGAVGFLERIGLLTERFYPVAGGSVTAPRNGNGSLVTKGAGGVTIATQAVSDDGTTQTLGPPQ